MPEPTPRNDVRHRGRPPVLGICGGVGSGKSAVAAAFARLGAAVSDADRLAHAALDEPDVRAALVARFGEEILGSDGRIERARLRPKVFGSNPEALAARRDLEAAVHPRVRRLLDDQITSFTSRVPPPPLVVLDVPLLTEGPTADRCDAILFVDAPKDARRARTAATRGWTPEEHDARESAQSDVAAKRARADYVIKNHGGLDSLERDVAVVFDAVIAASRGTPQT